MSITEQQLCCSPPAALQYANFKIRKHGLFLFLVIFFVQDNYTLAQPRSCKVDTDCSSWRKNSICRSNGSCSNPFYRGGCLAQRLENWPKIRVCHSEDPPEAAKLGYCHPSGSPCDVHDRPCHGIPYPEIRIATGNWESAVFQSWLFQIILSEVLGIPATVESGKPDVKTNFYDEDNPFQFGIAYDWDGLSRAYKRNGDCQWYQKMNKKNRNSETSKEQKYLTCAHVMSEMWHGQYEGVNRSLVEGSIEHPVSSGMLGDAGWYVPQFTGKRDPTLLSYLGLQGEENREKLANTFLRPTTFRDYCEEVSETKCIDEGSNWTATRPPKDESEYDRMFVQDVYKGHFRKTAENNCTGEGIKNCTGHIADYPCGWSSAVEQISYHLGVPLKSSGNEPNSRGYAYSRLVEIWEAANATKSDIMIRWWTPEALYHTFIGSDAQFQKVTLPFPTQECIENRVSATERCMPDLKDRIGDSRGSCGHRPHNVRRVLSTTVLTRAKNPRVPSSLWSPAYEVLKTFQISELQMGQIFEDWLKTADGQLGTDPRDAVCEWLANNLDTVEAVIPRTYPRVTQENDSPYDDPLQYIALVISIISITITVITTSGTVRFRAKQAVRYAQPEFLWLLLVGLFLVTVDSMLWVVRPTDLICVVAVWLLNVGYTLELVPLIVKVAAINRVVHASRRFQRVNLSRRKLFEIVIALVLLVVAFMVCWTVIDPPRRMPEYKLTEKTTEWDEYIVEVGYFCDSGSGLWLAGSLIWHALLLLTATVMAFQTRNLRDEFNESRTLATLIYSHFVFVLFRVTIFALQDSLGVWRTSRLVSLVLAGDVIATCFIYFFPKFVSTAKPAETPGRAAFSSLNAVRMSGSHGLICSECSTSFQLDQRQLSRDLSSLEMLPPESRRTVADTELPSVVENSRENNEDSSLCIDTVPDVEKSEEATPVGESSDHSGDKNREKKEIGATDDETKSTEKVSEETMESSQTG